MREDGASEDGIYSPIRLEGAQLHLDSVTKTYGSVVAVDDLTLSIGDGQYHCLLGPNGSGKSTVLRLLLGLTQPTAGTRRVSDTVVGCGFQQPNFYPGLTVRENIETFASLVGGTEAAWNQTVIENLRLERALDREASELSGGFAHKLDLALALLKQPEVLVLDEPLSALDDVSKAHFLRFMTEYAGGARTVLVCTHRVTEFEEHLDRVTVMHRGSAIFDRRTDTLELAPEESLQEYYVNTILEREGVSRSSD
jgi:ABC-2 type transport system ATP-binding protein